MFSFFLLLFRSAIYCTTILINALECVPLLQIYALCPNSAAEAIFRLTSQQRLLSSSFSKFTILTFSITLVGSWKQIRICFWQVQRGRNFLSPSAVKWKVRYVWIRWLSSEVHFKLPYEIILLTDLLSFKFIQFYNVIIYYKPGKISHTARGKSRF